MPTELKMPALSPTMEEGTLAKWLVKEGDEVKSGDILAEIETDKATMEFEAVDEGKIAKILVPEGTDGVKVGQPIALLAAWSSSSAFAIVSGCSSDMRPPRGSARRASSLPPRTTQKPPPTSASAARAARMSVGSLPTTQRLWLSWPTLEAMAPSRSPKPMA